MTLTFAETHNMIAYLTKSDASKGFNQIIDFLNGSSIKYALTVNANIYVSCIKQFWTTVAVKKVNDIMRLQALVDKKKVVVTEATYRDAHCLDDAEGVECLPNEEIFAELARMGFEKHFTKLTFYKAFFSSQWKFLIHTILQYMSAKKTSWNEFSSSMAFTVICLSSGKGFSGVKTPLFKGMLVAQEVGKGVADEGVPAAGVATEGVVSADDDVVLTADEEPSIPSPTPPTPPPQPSHDIPSTSQERMVVDMDANADVVLEETKDVAADAKDDQDADVQDNADIQGRTAESQAKIYKINLNHANKVLSMQEEESEPAELQEVVDIVTTAKIITKVVTAASTTITAAEVPIPAATTDVALTLTAAPSRRIKGVVIKDPEESNTTTSIIIHPEAKSKDKGKGVLEKEDKLVKRYQALKRKPQTEAQARKNMMIYLKNVAGFKIEYFKGISYDDIRPIFEKHFDSNEKAAKKKKLEEEVEELKRHLQIMPNEEDDVYIEATSFARKVPVVDYEINQNNKPYYKIKRADGSHQLYLSFLSLLRNFNREDLEALWSLVKERFATTKPKNFFDYFLLITLGAMFEKPDTHAQI
nr:hypothetical protein [Tanacetum cinerariifolium]